MFSRFTEKAIQAIMLAQEEAKKFNHHYVGTEHILLGILTEGNNIVTQTVMKMSFNPKKIKSTLEDRLDFNNSAAEHSNIPFTQQAKQLLTYAWDESRRLGHSYVNIEHLFLSIFREPNSVAARFLSEIGITSDRFKDVLFQNLSGSKPAAKTRRVSPPTPALDLFGRDLTRLAMNQSMDPIIGRAKEIDRMIQILCRRTKNNPVLTGEAGVGKTAVVEGLAQRLITDDIPEKLKSKRVVSLDLGLLIAGTKYRGEFEERIKKIMEETQKAKDIILFIDELHTIIGTGGSEGSLDAANLLKPALARGELQCIGATTLEEYRKHIEQDSALERRFQSVLVEEPSESDAVAILTGIKTRYESYHHVSFTPEALQACVSLSKRYIPDRNLPDKAVDLMDEAAAKVMIAFSKLPKEVKDINLAAPDKPSGDTDAMATDTKDMPVTDFSTLMRTDPDRYYDYCIHHQLVDVPIIHAVLSNWTGINIAQLNQKETERLKLINDTLKGAVIGQDDAIDAISRSVKRAKVGLKDPNRPVGSFLFLGPSGVGKSSLAKELALFLFADKEAIIRIDMTEFMEKHTVSRLIGAPPGYVGYKDGGELTEAVRRRPYSVVLFDEIEKASPDVVNILLQILDDGRLTDANGRRIDFKNTIIIMTSNVGNKYIQNSSSFGFHKPGTEANYDKQAIEKKINEELLTVFKPEMLNRIDETVIFNRLSEPDLLRIVDIMLADTCQRLAQKNIVINYKPEVKAFLVKKGFNQNQGARPLRRAIQTYFEDALVDTMLAKNIKDSITATAVMNADQTKLTFRIRTRKPVKKKQLAQA